MFERINAEEKENEQFTFFFEGEPISASDGDTIAAALLAADTLQFRTSRISGKPRGPFCLMGACYECLVEVDGQTVQACMTPARPNAKAHRPPASDLASDLTLDRISESADEVRDEAV